jgi:uncharacterized protein
VILSQVLRAVAEVAAEVEAGEGTNHLDASGYAQALERARELAYDAVAEPVEGTILTVIAESARVAREAAASQGLVAVSAATCAAASRAVAATTDQLDVLRDAGVVDAGARGFEVMLGAVHAHLTGEPAPTLADVTPRSRPHREACEDDLGYRYEVQYLLDASDEDAGPLRKRLELLGDSVVVVAAGDLLNVHVHTDDVGAAIEAGLELGRPSGIEVTHFGDQLAARRQDRGAVVGALAVLDGAGARQLAEAQGAVVVTGYAGALPSVADLLNAVGEVRTEQVVLLPGHPNAVPTAHQAVAVAVAEGGRPLEVVDAADSPCSVLAALSLLDPQGPTDLVVGDMRAAAEGLRDGEVVAAVRDASTPIGAVRAGQPLAVVHGRWWALSRTRWRPWRWCARVSGSPRRADHAAARPRRPGRRAGACRAPRACPRRWRGGGHRHRPPPVPLRGRCGVSLHLDARVTGVSGIGSKAAATLEDALGSARCVTCSSTIPAATTTRARSSTCRRSASTSPPP